MDNFDNNFLKRQVSDAVRAGRACAHPIWSAKFDGWVRCGSRDAARCRYCANIHTLHTKMILGGGFSAVDYPADDFSFFFGTLTAPSFGKVHSAPHGPGDVVNRCSCGSFHRFDDPLAGTPVDVKRYRYRDQVLWNRDSSKLWNNTISQVMKRFPEAEWAVVREFQRRLAIHFHFFIRVPSDDAVALMAFSPELRKFSFRSTTWGRSMDFVPLPGSDGAEAVRYASKMVGYATKTLGKSVELAAEPRLVFFDKLDKVSISEDLSDAAVRGFGYGGHLFSKSKGWSSQSKGALRDAAREYAERSETVLMPQSFVDALAAGSDQEVLDEFHSAVGFGSDYAEALRVRFFADPADSTTVDVGVVASSLDTSALVDGVDLDDDEEF